jgi:hypothetical protein
MLALQDALDMRDDNLVKAAGGLHGGIAVMHDTCGSLISASLILSLKYGRGREETGNPENQDDSYQVIGKLYKWFEKEFGSVTCREICTRFAGGVFYDQKVPWQVELAREAGMFEKCDDLTGKVAAKTIELLWDAIEAEKRSKGVD